jgi:hypothetical protein
LYDIVRCMTTPDHARISGAAARDADSLIQKELECGAFPDERLGKRFCGDPPKSGPLVMLVCGPKR